MIGELIPTGVTYGVGRISLNDQFSGTAEFNDVEVAGNLSAGTGGVIYSGGTDLYGIFLTNATDATTASNGLTKSGDNITLGGTLTGNTSIDVNGSYLNFVNTNPTTIAGDYKYRFLDGVTTPTIATENVSNYTEFKPITTGGAYQFASGVVMYANPSGNTNSEFYAGADLTLITTDLNKFQDSVAASLSILQFASNTGTFSGGFANAHTSTFRNLLSGNNIQNLAHYQAFGIETDGTNASVIDNLYGFYMRNSSDGNITNKWGVYIDDPNANNYFAGNVDVDGILTSGGTDLYNIFNTTAPSGGGVDSYINLGTTGSTINWNVSGLSTNYRVTLSAATTLNLTNVRNGEYGTIIVTQDGVGGRNLTFGTVNGLAGTHRVVNGGGGAPTLTSTASATDILSFTYNGSTMYWTVGNDYT